MGVFSIMVVFGTELINTYRLYIQEIHDMTKSVQKVFGFS